MSNLSLSLSDFTEIHPSVFVINACPHPYRFQKVDGDVVEVPSCAEAVSALRAEEELKLSAWEEEVDVEYIETTYIPTSEGLAFIQAFQEFTKDLPGCHLIIGSIISAKAYGRPVVQGASVPGYERVAPAEKVFLPNRFKIA